MKDYAEGLLKLKEASCLDDRSREEGQRALESALCELKGAALREQVSSWWLVWEPAATCSLSSHPLVRVHKLPAAALCSASCALRSIHKPPAAGAAHQISVAS